MRSIDLRFPLSEVLIIAEHAMAASHHSRSLFEPASAPPEPSLIWAKNEGTYLYSNGLPRQSLDTDTPLHVYARGHGPGTENLGSTALGAVDFAEYIALTDRDVDGETLIHQIREFAGLDGLDGWMIITAAPGTYQVSLSTHPAPICSRPFGKGARSARSARIFTWLPHRRRDRRDV
ncbi:hypothetical protein ACTD5D_22650 [Nocardia takedensis]|uniref:hypothetical protein n=1 Tax=Nocardia takedensis TaxID=259390 RepID=UPI003F76930F